MIWKIWKTIVKRYRKYGKQLWKDMENMEKRQVEMWNDERKVSWIVKCYGKCGRKVSWNVTCYGKYGINASQIVKIFGKYRRKLWKDIKNME